MQKLGNLIDKNNIINIEPDNINKVKNYLGKYIIYSPNIWARWNQIKNTCAMGSGMPVISSVRIEVEVIIIKMFYC